MAEPSEFVQVGIVSDLVEVWVLAELAVFGSLASGFIEDGKGPFLQKGRGICEAGGGMG